MNTELNEVSEVVDTYVDVLLSTDHQMALKVSDDNHLIWMNLSSGLEYINIFKPVSQYSLSYQGDICAYLTKDELTIHEKESKKVFYLKPKYVLEQILISDSGSKMVTIEYDSEEKMHYLFWRNVGDDFNIENSISLELGQFNFSESNSDLSLIYLQNSMPLDNDNKAYLVSLDGLEIETKELKNIESVEIFDTKALITFESEKVLYDQVSKISSAPVNSYSDIYINDHKNFYVLELLKLDPNNNEVYDVRISEDFGLTSKSLDIMITLSGNEVPLVLGDELIKYAL